MIQDLFGDASRKPSRPEVATSTPTVVVKPPVVATQPAVAKPAATEPPAADQSKDVLKTVHDWAAAWSAKNTSKYLAHYAADFKAPKGASRAAWEAERKERISKPKSIHVGISNPTTTFSDTDHARVEFRQSYSAGQFKTSSSKTLLMAKSGEKWLIQEERVK